ncbi:glycosyltransferase [Gilvimarinus agarilyticus]|uniref:glycosyltransferase n=1 Tax=Gilvimarinus sp. 2_MG-2023 TaxID=3062666 RepID=UPI001C09526C|nr:glycosyltransferase [Gilvimarinus sp. 2_MG-2023]MBU2887571.1 glycosyltransferase [Gilvimarinus agarilyticus]MDO6572222.1 glycosyltransferase [Gilvimarinus sp. 2_MG-2023]
MTPKYRLLSPLTVVVPVYRGLSEIQACLRSVAATLPPATQVIIVNDCSPEAGVAELCREYALLSHFDLIEHRENLGFVKTVNEAMRKAADRDVVLLNCDTEVSADWLLRLQKTAYREESIATVTPFSNNATICSYPDFCQENECLPGFDVAAMDALFQTANRGLSQEIPTAVGFCMYIKRKCLEDVGYFDEEAFGKGYGEENDFCERAKRTGWKHMIAADCYVYHKGSVSFLGDKSKLTHNAEQVIATRYPQFFSQVQRFIELDPLESSRDRVTRLVNTLKQNSHSFADSIAQNVNNPKMMMNSSANSLEITPFVAQVCDEILRSETPTLLFISHGWGGGVEQYIQSLIGLSNVNVLVLRGLGASSVEIGFYSESGQQATQTLGGFNADNQELWLGVINAFNVDRVHLHHVQGWPSEIVDFILALNKPLDISLHDHYLMTPKYHGIESGPRCDDASWPQDDMAWQQRLRPLVDRASRIIAPSESIKAECENVYSGVAIEYQPHPEKIERTPNIYKVVVIGALTDEKGLQVVEEVAALSAEQSPQLQITLLGYPTRAVTKNIHITGDYQSDELPRLLAAEKPDAVWFPAQVAETYSYTLSQAMALGCPIVATDLGALACRLADYQFATLLAKTSNAHGWLAALHKAVNYQTETTATYMDNTAEYKSWYCQPLKQAEPAVQQDILTLLNTLQQLPGAIQADDKPFKSLYDFAYNANHRGIFKEIRRRLQVVPDTETEVAGMDQYRAALSQFHQVSEDYESLKHDFIIQVNGLKDELSIQVAEFNELKRSSTETIELYDSNLSAAQKDIGSLQEQAHHARQQIVNLEQERDAARDHVRQVERFANDLERERSDLLNSTSWKITRPMRVAMRALRVIVSFAKFSLRLLMRPASYSRAMSMLRRGQWREIGSRLGLEVTKHKAHERAQEIAQTEKSQKLAEFSEITSPGASLEPLVLNTSDAPTLSIVIPVYGQHETTYQCLSSISKHPPKVPFEVIIADDCSPDNAEVALNMVSGVSFCRGEKNLGFVGNMNFGAEQANGDMLVLLNNDTVVCAGAFDRLLETFSEHENVGLVGAKLLNKDGTLQEAGGIIWRDGSGWNWGRNMDADDPRFNYVRDVDYCSGAVLAVRRELFSEMGGFDTHYMPAYYEDTDLAFRVRERGLRVLYQPAAEVFHIEGVSHGTDERSGIKASQVTNGEKFYQRWKDVLKLHNENAVDPENQAHRYCKGNVLIIEACMITPDQDSGSIRMFNLLKVLKEEGYHVTFVADNLEYREKVIRQLNALGVEVLFDQWAGSVRNVLRKRGGSLDAVFISRHYIASQYDNLVRLVAPQAKLVFDTVDLHYIREEREAEIANDSALKAQAAITKRKELRLIDNADVTIVVSEYEKALLAEIKPEARVEVVSNIHAHTPERPDYEQREGILFVGGFRHPPNIDAVHWYASEILPELRKLLPDVVTTIIGSHMPDDIKALATDDIRILGFVEDIEPELKAARVSIAPLRYGAGVKGKVNEAMNYGIPVVATDCAVEGMHVVDGEDVLVAENAKVFAKQIADVYQSQSLWNKVSQGGIRNLETYFSPDAARPALRNILTK